MLGRENTGSALGSEAVDADFWALVCEDEEWLGAEFDAIVSEACETPTRSRRRFSTGTDPNARARRRRGPPGRSLPRPGCPPTQLTPLMTGDGERTVM